MSNPTLPSVARSLGDRVAGLDRAGLERLVDTLERLHGQGPALATEEAVSAVGEAFNGPEQLYQAVEAQFGKLEGTLRAQSAIASRLVERLRTRPHGPTQQLLDLICAPGSAAGGRFLVANRTSKPALVRFVPRFELPVRFLPDGVTLAPGEEREIDVRFDTLPPLPATLLVDVEADEVVRMKLWIDLRGSADGR